MWIVVIFAMIREVTRVRISRIQGLNRRTVGGRAAGWTHAGGVLRSWGLLALKAGPIMAWYVTVRWRSSDDTCSSWRVLSLQWHGSLVVGSRHHAKGCLHEERGSTRWTLDHCVRRIIREIRRSCQVGMMRMMVLKHRMMLRVKPTDVS